MTKEEEIDAAWDWYQQVEEPFPGLVHRARLAEEQNWLCHYCDVEMKDYDGMTHQDNDVSLDHKTPKCRGGTNELDNLVAACRKCNSDKSDTDYDAFMRYIGK